MTPDPAQREKTVLRYENLFFGLTPSELPSFDTLLNLHIEPHPPWEVLPQPLRETICRNLDPIHRVCRNCGYIPLISELSIIADRRTLPDGAGAYFVSFLSFFFQLDAGRREAVTKAYVAAMNFMGTPAAHEDQIVPHLHLYDPSNVLIAMNCVAERSHRITMSTDCGTILETPTHVAAFHHVFKYGPSRTNILTQVETFVDQVLTEFQSPLAVPRDIATLIAKSTLVLIPFTRPHYEPALPTHPASQQSEAQGAVPAGALFFFLLENENCSGLQQLGTSLSLLVSAASIKESSSSLTSLDVAIKTRQLFGSMVHGTTHAIRCIGATDLSDAVAWVTPPRDVTDLRVRIFKEHEDAEDHESARYLVSALRKAMLGEDTAAALLSFSELHLSNGRLRLKFQNSSEAPISTLLEEALLLVNPLAFEKRTQSARVDLAPVTQIAPIGENDGSWILPTRYLDAKIIRGVFAELIGNAALYGRRVYKLSSHNTSEEAVVVVQCRVVELDGLLSCEFTNEIPTDPNTSHVNAATSGFLLRTRRALQGSQSGIYLNLAYDSAHFVATLVLGPTRSENEDHSISDVVPYWKATERG